MDNRTWLAEELSRSDAIVLNAEDGNQALIAIRMIIRPANGKPYLTKLEINRDHGANGRFSGLLSGPRLKSTSELPADEGTVYVTAVPDAPFQILGRRANDGELYVGSIMRPRKGKTVQELRERAAAMSVETLTGPEAQKLIAAVTKSRTAMQ